MNLGIVCVESFLLIIVAALPLAFGLASVLRLRSLSWHTIMLATLPVWLIVGYALLHLGHQRLFVAWHRLQNTAVPQEGCVSYEPQFNRLLAKYSMSEDDFWAWVRTHPWGLSQVASPYEYDLQQLNIIEPAFSFCSEPAPNGAQLRVYYKTGVAYIAYYVN